MLRGICIAVISQKRKYRKRMVIQENLEQNKTNSQMNEYSEREVVINDSENRKDYEGRF